MRVLNISYLSECITVEIDIGNKICHFISLYRSPSQAQDEFQTFTSNLKLNLDAILCGNSFLHTVMIGHSNANFKGWCSIDITITIILRENLMFYQIFLSTQVKQSLISSSKLTYTRCLTSCHTT